MNQHDEERKKEWTSWAALRFVAGQSWWDSSFYSFLLWLVCKSNCQWESWHLFVLSSEGVKNHWQRWKTSVKLTLESKGCDVCFSRIFADRCWSSSKPPAMEPTWWAPHSGWGTRVRPSEKCFKRLFDKEARGGDGRKPPSVRDGFHPIIIQKDCRLSFLNSHRSCGTQQVEYSDFKSEKKNRTGEIE